MHMSEFETPHALRFAYHILRNCMQPSLLVWCSTYKASHQLLNLITNTLRQKSSLHGVRRIEASTDWFNVTRSTKDNCWAFHEDIRFWTFSTKYSYVALVCLEWRIGTPRYFPKSSVIPYLVTLSSPWALDMWTFLDTIILIFSTLTIFLEAKQKSLRHCLTVFINCSHVVCPKTSKSSAKNIWDKSRLWRATRIDFHSLSSRAWWIKCGSRSIDKQNMEITDPLVSLL